MAICPSSTAWSRHANLLEAGTRQDQLFLRSPAASMAHHHRQRNSAFTALVTKAGSAQGNRIERDR